MKAIVIYFILLALSCNSHTKENKSSSGTKTHQYLLKNYINERDSVLFLDSLKWLFYSVNFKGVALFMDSNMQKIRLNPIECDIILEKQNSVHDTTFFFFAFQKKGFNFLYIDDIVFVRGFKVYDNIIHPIANHVIFDFETDKKSINNYVRLSDSLFLQFLNNNPEAKLTSWLKIELNKRRK